MPQQANINATWWHTDGECLLFAGFFGLRLVLTLIVLLLCGVPVFGLFVGLFVAFVRTRLLRALRVGAGLLGTV